MKLLSRSVGRFGRKEDVGVFWMSAKCGDNREVDINVVFVVGCTTVEWLVMLLVWIKCLL